MAQTTKQHTSCEKPHQSQQHTHGTQASKQASKMSRHKRHRKRTGKLHQTSKQSTGHTPPSKGERWLAANKGTGEEHTKSSWNHRSDSVRNTSSASSTPLAQKNSTGNQHHKLKGSKAHAHSQTHAHSHAHAQAHAHSHALEHTQTVNKHTKPHSQPHKRPPNKRTSPDPRPQSNQSTHRRRTPTHTHTTPRVMKPPQLNNTAAPPAPTSTAYTGITPIGGRPTG